MSAHKTAIVRLGEAEYRRLREAEEKLRLSEIQSNRKDDRGAKNSESIFEKMVHGIDERDQEVSRILSQVRNDQSIFQENVAGLVENLRDKIIEETEFSENWLIQQNERNQEELQADWISFRSQMEEILQDQKTNILLINEKNQQTMSEAKNLIESSSRLIEFIVSEYELNLQSANEVEMIRQEINDSIELYNQGRAELSWQVCRNALSQLTGIRRRLELEKVEIQTALEQLKQSVMDVADQIHHQHSVHAMDADGIELPDFVDVNYWTEGEYRYLEDQVDQAVAVISQLQTSDWIEIGEWREEIQLINERSLELVTRARLAVLASQLRFNVAQIVVQALESQGFYLEQASYNQNDFRGAFFAHTRNLAGNEVIVTIDPDPLLDEGGRLNIRSGDAREVTEHELVQRNLEIFQAIQDSGLSISETLQGMKNKNPIPTKMEQAKVKANLASRR